MKQKLISLFMLEIIITQWFYYKLNKKMHYLNLCNVYLYT